MRCTAASGIGSSGREHSADRSREGQDHPSDRTAGRTVSGAQSAQDGHLYGAGRVFVAENAADALRCFGQLHPLPLKLLGKSGPRSGDGRPQVHHRQRRKRPHQPHVFTKRKAAVSAKACARMKAASPSDSKESEGDTAYGSIISSRSCKTASGWLRPAHGARCR